KQSSEKISVYQIDDQNNYLLRQTYSTSSKCLVPNDTTLSCITLSSTFNRINRNYTIVADNNFARTLQNSEPLRGIKRDIWRVVTQKTHDSIMSESTKALLRLNSDGRLQYLKNSSKFNEDLLNQTKESIPLKTDNKQLRISNTQLDPSDSSKLLLEISINKATDSLNDQGVKDIIDDLDDIIKNKYISALSDKDYMKFIDETYGFKPT
ncbi:2407_t:CDS:2, partial [Scutellospora calospora]